MIGITTIMIMSTSTNTRVTIATKMLMMLMIWQLQECISHQFVIVRHVFWTVSIGKHKQLAETMEVQVRYEVV
jgi:hypothetical protein